MSQDTVIRNDNEFREAVEALAEAIYHLHDDGDPVNAAKAKKAPASINCV